MAVNRQETHECDVLVVGSGCAGMSAAVTAGHHGLNVLVVEKESRFGGTRARPTWFGRRLIAVRRVLPAEGVMELPVNASASVRGAPPEMENTLLYREPPVVY